MSTAHYLNKDFAYHPGNTPRVQRKPHSSAEHLCDGFTTHSILPDHAHPALKLGNHDLVRFGDLIQKASDLRYGPQNSDYWKHHKLVFSFMGAFTGPNILYYGEENGDRVEAYTGGRRLF